MRADQRWRFLCDALDDVLEACCAHKGNVQLVDAGGNLRIAASFGFDHRFLDYFDVVETAGTACGLALHRGQRVTVSDVAQSEIFAGTHARDVMLSADCHAVQSTPLIRDGKIFGIVSTHWRKPLALRLADACEMSRAIDRAAPQVWRAARMSDARSVGAASSVCR